MTLTVLLPGRDKRHLSDWRVGRWEIEGELGRGGDDEDEDGGEGERVERWEWEDGRM